ncbi:hypothetical protein ACI2KS_10495 [Pseudomonas sp. NPDC087358]|uniref:hypothetical protein n=1 Tax=Pseudomonas sp. NPDC087358 TaxID=3364439 RepID=UPI00384F989E
MLTKEEFVKRAFAVAAEMSRQEQWAYHIPSVDNQYIRFKSGKNVDAQCLERMYPAILQSEPDAGTANPVIMAATKRQGCVNVPMREIARRLRSRMS